MLLYQTLSAAPRAARSHLHAPSHLISLMLTLTVITSCLSCLSEGSGVRLSGEIFPERVSYPEAPYGVREGDVIEPLDFVNTEGEPVTLADIYDDDFTQLLLVTTSAEWCTACIKEQPKLEQLYQRYRERGLNVLVTLFEDANFEPATPEVAAAWRNKYDLNFSVLADPKSPSTFSPYYNIDLTPMVMLIDVATMKIVYLATSLNEDRVEELIDARLPLKLPRASVYPDVSYGREEGDVISDHSFTEPEGDDWSLSDTYRDLSKRTLLLTTSAEWCTACIKEQPKLEELYQEYGASGLEVAVVMFEDANFEPATPEIAARWRDKYELTFKVLADSASPSTLSAYYNIDLTPMVMVIDLNEMKIMYLATAFNEDTIRGLLEATLSP